MTFSIAARCEITGQFGVAISSSSPAVAARCAHVRSGTGAACTQNITDPRLGPALLDALASGSSAPEAIDALTRGVPGIEYRQLTLVDAVGRTATWSGSHCLGRVASAKGENVATGGNLLADVSIPTRMVLRFDETAGQALGDRLIAALLAALDAGGEEGPVHSAGLIIAAEVSWPVTDLRVDWSDDPINDLHALWRLWRPQADAYVTRALNPSEAPNYGVKGE